ncbi:MAG: hypothetical protein GY708_12050 [Actinomycetia bacterium]|nr:hypothetical protein [Actinomycetes bacterium]MCP4961599.1 hypothetical protein [Actinomycetes bacterium]
MTATAPPVGGLDEAADRPTRSIRPRRPWPGTRAAAGGLLVALAGLGLFIAFNQANTPPTTLYLVAREPIAPGTVLTTDLVGGQRMELPDSLASGAFTTTDDNFVLGSVALEAVAAGELIQRSDIRATESSTDLAPFEMSFRVEADRAVNGTLRPGEHIDILATVGSGAGAPTDLIDSDVMVIDVSKSGDSGLAGNRQVITIALDTTEQVLAITSAADKGTLTLVRSSMAR